MAGLLARPHLCPRAAASQLVQRADTVCCFAASNRGDAMTGGRLLPAGVRLGAMCRAIGARSRSRAGPPPWTRFQVATPFPALATRGVAVPWPGSGDGGQQRDMLAGADGAVASGAAVPRCCWSFYSQVSIGLGDVPATSGTSDGLARRALFASQGKITRTPSPCTESLSSRVRAMWLCSLSGNPWRGGQ